MMISMPFDPIYSCIRRSTHFNGVSLTSTSKLMYTYLLTCQRKSMDMQISNDTLSYELGISTKSVTFNVKLLEHAGLIKTAFGRHKKKIYQVVSQPEDFLCPDKTQPVKISDNRCKDYQV